MASNWSKWKASSRCSPTRPGCGFSGRSGGEVCVCDIHESLKIPQSKASRHLAYLRRTGLVDTRREGLWIHYRLGTFADPVLAAICDAVRHALTHVDTVHRDGERLQKRTGCCVPAPGELGRVTCCAPAAALTLASHEHGDRAGSLADAQSVLDLLQRSHLPVDGVSHCLSTAVVARQNGQIVGSAALEVYPDGALLRSVAVAPEAQRQGLGHELTAAAIRVAETLNVPALYLLRPRRSSSFPDLDSNASLAPTCRPPSRPRLNSPPHAHRVRP